ncbi:hypothetical protein G7Y89_g8117 [Cudoniella acicularis]|uniref:Xylanolytic transcriptional activator regulatory domain-containing protein n=1 Tax=Cudoniella acicularis TaxID=354080 RepID=A0A8H4W3W6_9HELO|nr:hypothetical protein G7Y89_g8117 [Cudoniella acicularis]
MEFDPEFFMSEVTAALAHVSPQYREPGEYPVEEDSIGLPPRNSAQEASETRITPPRARRDSTETLEVFTSNEDVNNDDLMEEQDGIPGYFQPDLDMTTAIQSSCPWLFPTEPSRPTQTDEDVSLDGRLMSSERLDLVPSFYTYTVKSCLMPIRRVQHELVTLYFQYIHPMFPVVDEAYFTEIHRKYRGQEQFMSVLDFVIYQAILAAGFGHLSEAQLQRTPYRSVHEGQEAQFDLVKARYWSQPTSDPVTLTQVCLILSLWSPGASGVQNNSYWINMAFKHANAGELWKSQPATANGRPCRRRLIWWCCIVRDRVLALGMRRPYRLHKAPFEEDLISQLDFGLEARSPSSTVDMQSKQTAILAFIWLCKLSEIMAAIAIFQQRTRFSRAWNGDSIGNSMSELDEVRIFDRDLSKWKEDFEGDASDVILGHGNQDVPTPVSILRIVCNSLVAVLYQPYLHLSWIDYPSGSQDKIDPLQRMKEGSQEVESSVIGLISNKKSDALPNWLVSWVMLPVAVYYVNQHAKLNPSPDKVLLPFLNRFMRRTTGAQVLFLILTMATKEYLQRLNDSKKADAAKLGRRIAPSPLTHQLDLPAVSNANSTSYTSHTGNRIVEAKMLAHVTKALDFALELRC